MERARQIARGNGWAGYTALHCVIRTSSPVPAPPSPSRVTGSAGSPTRSSTRNQVVLAWLSGGDPVVAPIAGVSGAEQLDEALAGVSLVLSAGHRDLLDRAA
ncbi:hypothetical protein [Streptosporangium sp. NPDC003464]